MASEEPGAKTATVNATPRVPISNRIPSLSRLSINSESFNSSIDHFY